MNKGIIFTAFISILLLPGLVQASCSLGANPLTMSTRAVPGQTVTATWNLYNLHGDRVTHVVITPELPPGWLVSLDPGLHEASYNVTGVLETMEENVGLVPAEVVYEIPDPKPEGMDYVKHPKEDGYIPVMPVDILITVPEDAELFRDYTITLEAVGNCFTEPGAVIPGIATQLEITVRTVSGEDYYEEPIEPEPAEGPETPEPGPAEEGEAGEEGTGLTGFLVANAAWIGIIAALIIIVLYLALSRKKPARTGYSGYSFTPE